VSAAQNVWRRERECVETLTETVATVLRPYVRGELPGGQGHGIRTSGRDRFQCMRLAEQHVFLCVHLSPGLTFAR
jgi:hypothetical protein